MLQEKQCKYCDTKFQYKTYGNFSVRCPHCYRLLEHVSDYGFGPVTPFYISIGSEVVGIVKSNRNDYCLDFQGREVELKETYLNAVHEAEEYVVEKLHLSIKAVEINIITKCGSLWFFGESFGRPYDNVHRIKSIKYDGELLEIMFDRGEELLIYNPENIRSNEKELKIGEASKVKWFYIPYGSYTRQRTETYKKESGKVTKITEYGEEVLENGMDSPAVLLAGY